jgi:hypothetical protein
MAALLVKGQEPVELSGFTLIWRAEAAIYSIE